MLFCTYLIQYHSPFPSSNPPQACEMLGIKFPSSNASRPSSPVILAAAALPKSRSPIRRWLVVAVLLVLWTHLHYFPFSRRGRAQMASLWPGTVEACRAKGLISDQGDPRKLAVKMMALAPHMRDEGLLGGVEPESTVLETEFHPAVSALRSAFFRTPSPPSQLEFLAPLSPSAPACVVPSVHAIEQHLPPPLHSPEPTLFFSFCTTPGRAIEYSYLWTHFLKPASCKSSFFGANDPIGQPGCIVIDAQGVGDIQGHASANEAFRNADTTCTMRDSTSMATERYELRVLGLVKDAWDEAEKQRETGGSTVEWFVFSDDDTWWMDLPSLKAYLSTLSFEDDHFLGGFTETHSNFAVFGPIAYGGAGMLLSRALVQKMAPMVEECARDFGHLWGGDGMLTSCAARARGVPSEGAIESTPGLSQMDMKGDATGYLSNRPHEFITLHHWAGWLELIPGRDQKEVIELFRKGVEAIGARNMFRRWSLDGGATLFTAGYAITIYRDALSQIELEQVEKTWDDHEPIRASRPGRIEGSDKITYYISSVEQLSPIVTLFVYTCAHPAVAEVFPELSILWDTSSSLRVNDPWWNVFGDWQAEGGLRGLRLKRRAKPPSVVLEQ